VYLHASDAAEAGMLDEQLWRFRAGAFVPHELAPATAACPVEIGSGTQAPATREVLITLAPEVPPFAAEFGRIAEILLGDVASRAAGRERWLAYRALGCTPDHHDIQTLGRNREH